MVGRQVPLGVDWLYCYNCRVRAEGGRREGGREGGIASLLIFYSLKLIAQLKSQNTHAEYARNLTTCTRLPNTCCIRSSYDITRNCIVPSGSTLSRTWCVIVLAPGGLPRRKHWNRWLLMAGYTVILRLATQYGGLELPRRNS